MCNDGIYRVSYDNHETGGNNINLTIALAILIGVTGLFISFYLYIYYQILRPFNRISEFPVEMAKGNMTGQIPESRNHYFGRFIWGLNMLSDTLMDDRQRELKLEKDKKTLILSISHDLKTPLSAVRLYASALKQGIYSTPEQIKETSEAIINKTTEIQNKINEIAEMSTEEFMNFTVDNREFYLNDLISKVKDGYKEALALGKTELRIEKYSNCLLYGDIDRSFEVAQNIMDNAIKYGDGRNINISINYEEDCCLVSISNSGCSLNSEESLHIFDCFYRGTNVKEKLGNGLGLYICRKLMQLMRGSIYAKTGEDFTITLVFKKI